MQYILRRLPNGMHYLQLEAAIVDGLLQQGHKRVLCTLNNSVSYHCALLYSKEVQHYVYVGSKIRKQVGLVAGDAVHATFVPDESKYQFGIPEEFAEVMRTDTAAAQIFENLSAGNQRGLMAYVAGVKNTYKRIERALLVAENLRNGQTSPRALVRPKI